MCYVFVICRFVDVHTLFEMKHSNSVVDVVSLLFNCTIVWTTDSETTIHIVDGQTRSSFSMQFYYLSKFASAELKTWYVVAVRELTMRYCVSRNISRKSWT